MRKLHIQLILLGFAFLVLSSCSHNVGMIVRSTSDVNNGGNPVVVRIYQLKSSGNFQRATVESFWGKEEATLGSDLLGDPIEIVLHPGERRKLKGIEMDEKTLFIGAAADFYQPNAVEWKSLIDVSNKKGVDLILAVGDNRLLLGSVK